MAAFCRRAYTIGNIRTKGVSEEFYDEAVEAAKVVDEGRSTQQRNGGGDGGNVEASTVGLLQGMPISIKDAMNMKGAVSERPRFVVAVSAVRPGVHLWRGSICRARSEYAAAKR